MFTSLDGPMFILPVCYHPATVLSIDDDKDFLDFLSLKVEKKIPILCFSSPEEAIKYARTKHNYLPFTSRCLLEEDEAIKFNLMSIRNEMFNPNRFKEIYIVITDYDMPKISGIEFIKTIEFHPEISQYSHIILTGKVSDEFKNQVSEMKMDENYIRKDDPNYINKLISLVEKRSSRIFQWYSYMPARVLSRNNQEKMTILFDGNFNSIFNEHVTKNKVCEFYLYDKQGSFVFLDENANLSWLFIRNEKGLMNSIRSAIRYGAPKSVVDVLKSKKYLLSLYEICDFESRKKIKWDDYLIPVTVLESNDRYLGFFSSLLPDKSKGNASITKYYYAFTEHFPENGIDKNQILSYTTFLQERD